MQAGLTSHDPGRSAVAQFAVGAFIYLDHRRNMLTFGSLLDTDHVHEEYEKVLHLSQQLKIRLTSFASLAEAASTGAELKSEVEGVLRGWQQLVETLIPQQRSAHDLHWRVSALTASLEVLQADIQVLRADNQALHAANDALRTENTALRIMLHNQSSTILQLQQRIESLELQQRTQVPCCEAEKVELYCLETLTRELTYQSSSFVQRQRILLGDLAYKVDRLVRSRVGLIKSRQTFWELRHAVAGELTAEQVAALQQVESDIRAAGWDVAELTSLQSTLKQPRLGDAHCSEDELRCTMPDQLKQYADDTLTDLQLRKDAKALVDLVRRLDPSRAPLQ